MATKKSNNDHEQNNMDQPFAKFHEHLFITIIVIKAHSFPRATKFRAEPRNLPFSAKFSRNFTEVKKWPMISTIVDFRLTIIIIVYSTIAKLTQCN